MARMKFLCDAERCIECNGCVTACKQEHDIPWGVNRRRVVTINDGVPGERSISVACMHCSDAPCMAVCPVDCFYKTEEGIVLHDKDLCIGCGYCFYACPFGAPQFPQTGAFGVRDGEYVWVKSPTGAQIKVKALVTERVASGTTFIPFHFSGWWMGKDILEHYPQGAAPIVRAEAVNTATTYGYDSVTMMQETKTTLCQVAKA